MKWYHHLENALMDVHYKLDWFRERIWGHLFCDACGKRTRFYYSTSGECPEQLCKKHGTADPCYYQCDHTGRGIGKCFACHRRRPLGCFVPKNYKDLDYDDLQDSKEYMCEQCGVNLVELDIEDKPV